MSFASFVTCLIRIFFSSKIYLTKQIFLQQILHFIKKNFKKEKYLFLQSESGLIKGNVKYKKMGKILIDKLRLNFTC